eukprot:scaffold114843_cov60-Phaeocystis_antarctica.AAC.1
MRRGRRPRPRPGGSCRRSRSTAAAAAPQWPPPASPRHRPRPVCWTAAARASGARAPRGYATRAPAGVQVRRCRSAGPQVTNLLYWLYTYYYLLLRPVYLVEEVEGVELLGEQRHAPHHEGHQGAVAVGADLSLRHHAEGGVAKVRHRVDGRLDLPGVDRDRDRLRLPHHEVLLL